MFSFIKKYAETMNGADIYPKIGLFIFLLVFFAMVWFGLKADKNYIAELENLPLNDHSGGNPSLNGNGLKEPQIPESQKA